MCKHGYFRSWLAVAFAGRQYRLYIQLDVRIRALQFLERSRKRNVSGDRGPNCASGRLRPRASALSARPRWVSEAPLPRGRHNVQLGRERPIDAAIVSWRPPLFDLTDGARRPFKRHGLFQASLYFLWCACLSKAYWGNAPPSPLQVCPACQPGLSLSATGASGRALRCRQGSFDGPRPMSLVALLGGTVLRQTGGGLPIGGVNKELLLQRPHGPCPENHRSRQGPCPRNAVSKADCRTV